MEVTQLPRSRLHCSHRVNMAVQTQKVQRASSVSVNVLVTEIRKHLCEETVEHDLLILLAHEFRTQRMGLTEFCFWISVKRTLTETELARCTFAGAAEAADDHADNGGPAVAPAPQSRRSLARARARAEGTGGHKLRVPEAQDTDSTATETEPAPAASAASEPDTSSMTNKERKAYFKAVRVTALDQPRAEKPPKKRAKAE